MRVLLLGKNGQVGQALQRALAPLGEVIALDRQALGLKEVLGDLRERVDGGVSAWSELVEALAPPGINADAQPELNLPASPARNKANPCVCGNLADLEALRQTIRLLRPEVIVNAAAYTAVDKAESEPSQARLINSLAPEMLAREAEALGAWLVHYSTDYVFDGSGATPWTETDPTGPLNVYGQTKLEGELLVQAACERHLIFRTSWVYAAHGSNFAKTMLKLAQERERLTVIDDQWGAPTGADLIARVTAGAIRQVMANTGDASDMADGREELKSLQNVKAVSASGGSLAGIYHLVAAGETSWHRYASYVIGQARALRPDLPWVVQEITPVPSTAFVTAARRPHNSRLSSQKLQANFGIALPPWQQGLDQMLAETLLTKKTP